MRDGQRRSAERDGDRGADGGVAPSPRRPGAPAGTGRSRPRSPTAVVAVRFTRGRVPAVRVISFGTSCVERRQIHARQAGCVASTRGAHARRSTLPLGTLGKASTTTIWRGRLYGASRGAARARISSASPSPRRWPPAPRRAARAGTPRTAASRTAGSVISAAWISSGITLKPPQMMTFFRPPGDEEVAVGVEVAEVAGMEPAVGVDGSCRSRRRRPTYLAVADRVRPRISPCSSGAASRPPTRCAARRPAADGRRSRAYVYRRARP